MSKELILMINKNYLLFFEVKIFILKDILYSLNYIYFEMVNNLINNYLLNNLLNVYIYRIFFIEKLLKKINKYNLNYTILYLIENINIYSVYIFLKKNG
jgi:hypothetical protein